MRNLLPLITLALLSACSAGTPPDATVPASTSAATPAAATATSPPAPVTSAAIPAPASVAQPSPTTSSPGFVDRVWRVAPTSSQQPGTTYTFLAGGALVIDAPGGTPMTGAWRQVDGKLTMVEEGIAYPTDIVELDDAHLVLRSHNPGGSVLIQLLAAPDAPLPLPTPR